MRPALRPLRLTRTIPRARIRRRLRGAVYDIALDNTAGRCTGVRRITVDGKPIDGNVLPVFTGGEHAISVVI